MTCQTHEISGLFHEKTRRREQGQLLVARDQVFSSDRHTLLERLSPANGPRFPEISEQRPMKINAVEIRPGNILEYEGGLWRSVKIQHTQPGKGGAYMQVEMKNLRDGRKTNVRFRSAESVEKVRLDQKDFQFLYAEGDDLVFMNKETYDQVTLPRDLLGDAAAFLQDGMDVVMEMYEDEALSVALPDTIEATIVEADAVVKGQTASSSYKPAILDNGVRVMVPPHISAGTRIVVDVYEQTYVKRAE
jgi:elongation factor P